MPVDRLNGTLPRLRQKSFSSVYQEAILSVLVAAEEINRRLSDLCEQHGITIQQYNVLRILRGAYPEGQPRCAIMERMIQKAPDVTRLIHRLVDQGYAARGKSTSDARLSLTYITQQGMDLLDILSPAITGLELDLAAIMSKNQAKTLAELCDTLISM